MGRKSSEHEKPDRVAVLGLGRFGTSLGLELMARGTDVLGVDADPARVQRVSDELTHTAVVDTTDHAALRQLDVQHFPRVVVCIGTDLEASILTTAVLADLGIHHIWAKATSRQHARILERVGALHVVLPEQEMGERVAHLVTGRMLDYIEFDEDFAMVKTAAPTDAVGMSLGEAGLRRRHGITVVAMKKPDGEFGYTTHDTVIGPDDVLIASGTISAVEAFANRT